ncbi:MAG: ATP-binding protein [Staphylococcus sp.]|nr:ATP-binding protein [Staphylococcus sp.]
MKIALVGTHNSGKTTLFNMMKQDNVFKDYCFIGELIRELYNKGFGINENAKDDTQLALAMLNVYHQTNKNYKNIYGQIMDRCLLDNYIYAKYLSQNGIVSKKVVKLIKPLVNESMQYFDFIFLCSPEFEIVSDGIRNEDKNFQIKIYNMFIEYIEKESNFKDRVKILKGNSIERLETIKQLVYVKEMGW